MQKLAAADANFLYSETDKCTSNIGSVQVLELPVDVSPSQFVETLKAYMLERLHLVSYLNQKLSFVPGNWDHPVWVKDQNVDINNHVIELTVAAPGSRLEMEQAIAAIHEVKMDLTRPLWAMYVLTGLADGKVAYYNQAHHAALDGMSGQAATMILMDETPDHPPVPVPESVSEHEDASAITLIEDSLQNFMRYQLEAGSRALGNFDTSRRLMQRAIDPTKAFGAFGKLAPETPFNNQISEKRSWATSEFELTELKQMGKTVHCTLNHVVMAICAGGLKTYLDRQGKLPSESLIAGCPVSLRKPEDKTMGNKVTMMTVELATQIAHPVERLLAIKESSDTAKEITADMAGAFESNASVPGMPALISAGLTAQESWGMAQWLRGPVNLVISNVPGPRKTLYSNGARMTTHYPVSIPAHGVGLNITVQSYVDHVYLGITACGKALPDAGLLRDDLVAAYKELRDKLLPQNVSELKPRAPLQATQTSPVTHEMPQDEVA
jgi:diacylglycerol O-acyltransferase